MTSIYNEPNGKPSSIGTQFNTFKWDRKSLIEAKEKAVFSQMASMINQPKHMGKEIKLYHYLPLLSSANINDQGIDATGASTAMKATIKIIAAFGNGTTATADGENIYTTKYAVGEASTGGAATTAAKARALDIMTKELGLVGADYNAAKTKAVAAGYAVIDNIAPVPATGNFYGDSKSIGDISAKFPVLGEEGGRYNRVALKRKELKGTFSKFGFFEEYTKESVDFDTDEELEMHKRRELVNGAYEMNEDALQIDLLNAAGVVRYAGEAVSKATITGEGGKGKLSLLTYADIRRMSIDLTNNRCPMKTTLVNGSRLTDTKTIQGARYAYVGSEMQPMLEMMEDDFGKPAFVHAHHYADATKIAEGEIGSIGQMRFIVAPKMLSWAGAGATVTTNPGFRETGGKYDVFPMLIVGDDSFNTIGFQTDGSSNKFKIKHVKPESDISYSEANPFGEKGFTSIKWYYGFLAKRPERILLAQCVAYW